MAEIQGEVREEEKQVCPGDTCESWSLRFHNKWQMGEGSWRKEQKSPKPMLDKSRVRGTIGLLKYEMYPGG